MFVAPGPMECWNRTWCSLPHNQVLMSAEPNFCSSRSSARLSAPSSTSVRVSTSAVAGSSHMVESPFGPLVHTRNAGSVRSMSSSRCSSNLHGSTSYICGHSGGAAGLPRSVSPRRGRWSCPPRPPAPRRSPAARAAARRHAARGRRCPTRRRRPASPASPPSTPAGGRWRRAIFAVTSSGRASAAANRNGSMRRASRLAVSYW